MKQLLSQLSNYFWSLEKKGATYYRAVIPKYSLQFGCEYLQMEAERLHFKPIFVI